jgi:uncharacterized protein (TIGR02001 family)
MSFATPALAEVGAAVSLFSDARFRGYSLSDRRPVAIFDLSYDDPEGAYAAVSASTVLRSDGVRPLGLQLNGGYAKRLSPMLSLDLGLVHSIYSHYSSADPGRSYTELYAGLTHGSISGRLHVSPHYFESGTSTLYGELDNSLPIARKLRLSGHVGLLTPIRRRDGSETRSAFDWRLGLSHELGRFSLHAAWTGRARLSDNEDERGHGGSALVFGASCIF